MPRPPASNRLMEVKLTNQECELFALLKRLPIGKFDPQSLIDPRFSSV